MTTEVSAGKGNNGVYIYNKTNSSGSQTDIGVKAGYKTENSGASANFILRLGIM